MALTREEVQKVAMLARLQLSEEELELFTRQLGQIIDYVRQLEELDTEAVEPPAHPLPVQNVFRSDEPGRSLPVEQALANAPRRDREFFLVPPVLE